MNMYQTVYKTMEILFQNCKSSSTKQMYYSGISIHQKKTNKIKIKLI